MSKVLLAWILGTSHYFSVVENWLAR